MPVFLYVIAKTSEKPAIYNVALFGLIGCEPLSNSDPYVTISIISSSGLLSTSFCFLFYSLFSSFIFCSPKPDMARYDAISG